jgi:DNA-directed RNA polymerase subunit alpha
MTTQSLSTPAKSAPAESFDLATGAIPSFGVLVSLRADVFSRRQSVDSLRAQVERLGEDGEQGRRKGLGLWMLGRYGRAAELLARHEGDDVASFTRAKALMSLGRPAEARAIFERLSRAYPEEPRPRGGMLEAALEADLAAGMDPEQAKAALEKRLAEAPASFADSAEHRYLLGRAAELEGRIDLALDEYHAARELDPTHRSTLFRLAYLAERSGLDDLALATYQMLVEQLPIERTVLFNLGILYEDMGRESDAAACYDTILKSDPTDARARLYFEDAKQAIDMYYDEDQERKEDRLNQILRIPITDFELSVRARNCLNKMNILSLGDLVKLSEPELLAYKNFGETSLNEIKEILASKGLRLGMARDEAVASIEAHRRRYTTGDNVEAMNRPISDLELSIRARRTVEALGCITIGDVCQHSEEELLAMPNFGQTSLQELRNRLAEHGLKLKPRAK